MKGLTSRIFEFIFKATVFLIPTQLALHFWPPSAHIFGIRIDYLSPALYLTDVLVIFLLVQRTSIRFFSKLNVAIVALLGLFIVINVTQAQSIYPAIVKWLKVGEWALFIWLVKSEKGLDIKSWVIYPLALSVVFFSLIGFIQLFLGHTIGGIFYYLGERSFNIATPGISKFYFFGKEFLRAYSTFSHPNSFAGFLGVSLFLVALVFRPKGKREITIKRASLAIGFLAILLTASSGAFVALATGILFWFISNWRRKAFARTVPKFLVAVIVFSIFLPFFYLTDPGVFTFSEESLSQRLLLLGAAGRMIGQSPLWGVGLNNFIVILPSLSTAASPIWLLQPVHNIFLLVFSETGLIGLLLFSFLIFKVTKHLLETGNWKLVIPVLFVITTGLFDHYWLTLQQNQLLLSLLFGLSLRHE